jgi:lipopolysaccharide/colanic/teichoic acid biosynthesis glycosyltransferase
MLLVALLIRLDSKGPVFYRAQRIGDEGADVRVHQVPHHGERCGSDAFGAWRI